MLNIIRFSFIVVFYLSFTLAPNAAAQSAVTDPHQAAIELSAKVMSPYCPGRLLTDCPSTKASELRAKIEQDFASGKTAEEILSALETSYGRAIESTPPMSGFGAVAWFAVPVVFIAALALILRWMGLQVKED